MWSRLAVPLLFVAFSFAQNLNDGQINGVVFFKDGQPADHIMVHLQGTRSGVDIDRATDPQGKFSFGGLFRRDVYSITIEARGFQPVNNHYDLSIGPRAYDSITLRPVPSGEPPNVPPEGPKATLDARQLQISKEAKSEYLLGQKQMEAKEAEDAIAHFKKAIDLFPNYAEAYQLLGGVYLGQGNLALAEQAFAKAVAIESRLPNAQLALGLTRNLMGNTPAAERPLQTAVELDPKNPDAHFELAKNQFALQKFPEAQVQAEQSLELKPQNPPVYVVLGYSLLRQKKVTAAEEAFRRFLKLAPTSPMAGDIREVVAMIEQHQKQTRQP
jgi:tetratricopeptide (TPR) repeat protein